MHVPAVNLHYHNILEHKAYSSLGSTILLLVESDESVFHSNVIVDRLLNLSALSQSCCRRSLLLGATPPPRLGDLITNTAASQRSGILPINRAGTGVKEECCV